ncbi:McrC family protein [Helicobacter cappadocius]|uniref:McrC family protein n=1 Tax=Helicobacter cappadocius TaxID=3063998 RepID=A0AA90PT40_9HELI|nr:MULTISPECIES: McrC family protein [unclassified Helicobacter]MDO7252358.1 McrC family protein [Helicobacter sp. faydin-H75]MDP2538225.1 McrC family protein [Helicobacter sp. faydin-H76]
MNNQISPKNTLQIIEWQKFDQEDIKSKIDGENIEAKAERIFNELRDFASYENNRFFLAIDKRGKALRAQNYVGLIQTKSGFCLEILPKIYDEDLSKIESEKVKKLETTKNLLVEMLKTLKNFPAKTSNLSNLSTSKTSLLEIFIQMFLSELTALIKKGIKSNYHSIEKNRFYLKGKLLFSQNIKHNLAHQERFYTRADEYTPDIPQNRLIKSTLELFSKMPLSLKTQGLLRECRFVFDDMPISKNIDKDFSSCHSDRSLKHYENILLWCKVFLKRENFTPYAGNSEAMALLFDMNHLFESYIAYHFKRYSHGWNIRIQDRGKYLLQNNQKNFCALCPDIVATKGEAETIILDTKWKKISKQTDISASDVYQMWAYVSKYKSNKVILIYPKVGDFQGEKEFTFKPENSQNICLEIIFVDLPLENEKTKIEEFFKRFKNT